jgi:hypothetical protein
MAAWRASSSSTGLRPSSHHSSRHPILKRNDDGGIRLIFIMQDASYYRRQAALAESLSRTAINLEIIGILRQMSRDYVEIAMNIERGQVTTSENAQLPLQYRPIR